MAIIGTWVDDLVGISPNDTDLDALEEVVVKYVELEKRGRPADLLGVDCHWNGPGNTELIPTQTTLIKNLAAANGVTGAKHSLPNPTCKKTTNAIKRPSRELLEGSSISDEQLGQKSDTMLIFWDDEQHHTAKPTLRQPWSYVGICYQRNSKGCDSKLQVGRSPSSRSEYMPTHPTEGKKPDPRQV